MTVLPHVSRLFQDYVCSLSAVGTSGQDASDAHAGQLQPFYSPNRFAQQWMQHPQAIDTTHRKTITELLREQNRSFGAGPATLANLDRLEQGAAAVVTGQQAGLFGGPLLTLLKAATAVRLAAEASRNGHPHVPIFWAASDDHDFEEVNQAVLLAESGNSLETLHLPTNSAPGRPVGKIQFGDGIVDLVKELGQTLGEGPVLELIQSLYTPTATFSSAFCALMSRIFTEHGLIVIDASARPFHALAANVLGTAILEADSIHQALLDRNEALERAGYHAQVTVGGASSLLFLIDEETGVRTALKKTPDADWTAGSKQYSTENLLQILDQAPERISPNVLLRPVMQDRLLPTSAYIGGPSEIAYFAQSQVVYEQVLGRTTPILPRFSATLVEPRLARVLAQHQLSLTDIFRSGDLAQHLAAQAMPVEVKRKLAAAGNALDRELKSLTDWMSRQDPGLGHAAEVAASKMQYQMNRLRQMSAAFTLNREEVLRRHGNALSQELFPQSNLQERVVAGVWFLARFGPSLVDRFVEEARADGSHRALFL